MTVCIIKWLVMEMNPHFSSTEPLSIFQLFICIHATFTVQVEFHSSEALTTTCPAPNIRQKS